MVLGSANPVTGQEMVVDCGSFSVSIPSGFKISKTSPVEDFELMRFSKAEKVYLTAYLGNAPNYPSPRAKKNKAETKVSGLGNVDITTEWQGYDLIRKEMRIKLSERSWPMFLHLSSADGLSRDEVMVAEKILSSVSVKKK